jgi:hypothetical protein
MYILCLLNETRVTTGDERRATKLSEAGDGDGTERSANSAPTRASPASSLGPVTLVTFFLSVSYR